MEVICEDADCKFNFDGVCNHKHVTRRTDCVDVIEDQQILDKLEDLDIRLDEIDAHIRALTMKLLHVLNQ